ncbi:transposase, IS4 family [Neisseria elongata subsp. glycolytica ATCC 29315]|uniref:Transposase, IS4 family n=1 Tax=Neisseria elongata subsp. glycolytica ATCC 29315 TaxID=546263 RepID=D4DS30_NEIEG|nr:transposase, IS4 family [Neisseria elongata subsp. glycolytica ATCC 29315]
MTKDKSAAKPHRAKIKMPVGQRKRLYRLGYKQHTRTDEEGYIGKLHITPANAHECNHLSPLLEGIADGTTVYADKGYDSKENRQHLKEHRLLDGIMRNPNFHLTGYRMPMRCLPGRRRYCAAAKQSDVRFGCFRRVV